MMSLNQRMQKKNVIFAGTDGSTWQLSLQEAVDWCSESVCAPGVLPEK